jgi:hypothetical protein
MVMKGPMVAPPLTQLLDNYKAAPPDKVQN